MHPAPDLTPLWTRTRAMFARALAATGGPVTIAAITGLTRFLQREVAAWIARLETIVRKLLLAEAARLPREPSSRTAGLQAHTFPAAHKRAAARSQSPRDLAQPETWPARFSLAPPRDPLAVPESRAPRIRALWGDSAPPAAVAAHATSARTKTGAAFRLARRFEALRRVLEDPQPHARRLAVLLARALRRFPEIVRRYVIQPARGAGWDNADPRLIVEVIAAAFAAEPALSDTS